MKNVRLEFNSVKVLRPKERWQLYFVIVTPHPTEADKWVLATVPQEPIKMIPGNDNTYHFDGGGASGVEGLFVLSTPMPKDRKVNVHVYLRHSRRNLRKTGEILKGVEKGLGKKAFGVVKDLLGPGSMGLVIADAARELIGDILEKIPDKDFGFLSAYEHFGPEFENQTEQDRKKDFSAGAELVYTWCVDE
jgi:hypothetical protein